MTTTAIPTTDSEAYTCPRCSTSHQMYPRAATPYVVPNGRLADRVSLAVLGDHGQPTQDLTWLCQCGTWLVTFRPLHDTVECTSCSIHRDRINPPSDYYLNPRYGQACACCGRTGTHQVQRGSAHQCRRGW